MQTKSQKTLKVFRGRRGATLFKGFNLFIEKFLGVDTNVLIGTWLEIYSHFLKNEGKVSAIRRMKDYYNYCLRFSCGIKTDPISFTRCDSQGFPTKLRSFKKHILGNQESCRAVLTILQLYKLEIVKPPYTLTSITEPYGGQEEPEWLDDFRKVVELSFDNDTTSRISSLHPGFHISGSNGPNGPSLGTAYVDREAIRGSNLESSIKNLCSILKMDSLNGLLDASQNHDEVISHKSKRDPAHSRIRIKYEPGGKTRPFAIYDFFSQSALKPIHDFSMNWLKKQETDSSSEHSKAANVVKEWTKDDKVSLWSYDLTSATDRFPVFLQEIVLEQMFGRQIKDLWKDIILNRTFTGPDGQMVRWSVGQPLGALSSWAVFSITHHMIIKTASFRSGKPDFKEYRIIGDDIVIRRDKTIAREYKSMLDSLNVDISINKSVLPEQCSRGNTAEIAKRLFCNGIEYTPVPPAAILEGLENPTGFKNLIEKSWERGYIRAGSPYPVQSLNLSKIEWASLTFPFRNRSPQLNGVRSLFSRWDPFDDAPAGLNPGWFIWSATSDEIIEKASRRFLFEKVNKAVAESNRIQQQVLLARYMKSERDDLPQGGNWQPGPFDCHPEILTEVFSELQEILMKNQSKLWDNNYLLGDVVDLYTYIGSLHKYLEPRILLSGRDKVIDEKRKTLIFVSSMVRYISSIVVNNRYDILDTEPEVESFPLEDDFGFALVDSFE